MGRGLVTNEFVAVFELVKNGFDAGATRVDIEIDPDKGQISIVDNGKGMDRDDVISRWLFLARSEKAEGTEGANVPEDYRDRIKTPGQYAGNKGIGRLSCDTLGSDLALYSRKIGSEAIVLLGVDWKKFEEDSKKQFGAVEVDLGTAPRFPDLAQAPIPVESGTVLLITGTRTDWDEEKVRRLRQYLAKLIDPFGTTDDVEVVTHLVGAVGEVADELNGPVGNDIADVLAYKTTRIEVDIAGGQIETRLYDRGTLMLHVREPSDYEELADTTIRGNIYFLNRSAKATFTRRMGVNAVEFGSIFLFLNGFRIFPIGEQIDDTFGLNRRKQQGSSRYLGTRDVMGRVDVTAPPGVLREASSRDQGLIEDANRRALYEAIRKHMIFRLERYVVGVNWRVKEDQFREDRSALESSSAKALAAGVLGAIVRQRDLELLHVDPELFEIADARTASATKALDVLQDLAEESGREDLLGKVEAARARIAELEEAEKRASEEAARLAEARQRDAVRIQSLERQTRFLSASAAPDSDRFLLLIHQASIYSTHIDTSATVATSKLQRLIREVPDGDEINPEDLEDLAGALRKGFRDLRGDLSDISLEADRLKALCRFAPNLDVEINRPEVDDDLLAFLAEYIDVVVNGSDRAPRAKLETAEDAAFQARFSPFDVAVIIENLVDNARKFGAQEIVFRVASPIKKTIKIEVVDDGRGLGHADPARIFERGYTATEGGTGLGLYHVRQVLREMDGTIELSDKRDVGRADFVMTIKGSEA